MPTSTRAVLPMDARLGMSLALPAALLEHVKTTVGVGATDEHGFADECGLIPDNADPPFVPFVSSWLIECTLFLRGKFKRFTVEKRDAGCERCGVMTPLESLPPS